MSVVIGEEYKKKRKRSKKKLTIRKNALRGKVAENHFQISSGVFEWGAERMHHGGDFVMHPKPKSKSKKKRKPKDKDQKIVPVTELVKEFKEGEIVDTKTGKAVLSPLQKENGATVVKKWVFF